MIKENVKKRSILVVDDDLDILTLEQKLLTREGYEVTTATDGEKAVSLLCSQTFDLVLLDIMMPGMDGFEVSRTIQNVSSTGKIPVVFVTAKDDMGAMKEGFRSGGSVFLSKPFTASQLLSVVRTVIDSRAR